MAQHFGGNGNGKSEEKLAWIPQVVAGGDASEKGELSPALWVARAQYLEQRWSRWEVMARRKGRDESASALAQCLADLRGAVAEVGDHLILLHELRDTLVNAVERTIRSEFGRG